MTSPTFIEEAPESRDEIVPVRHPWRLLATVVVLVLLAMLVNALVTEPGFQWGVVGHYLFAHQVLSGVGVTLELTASAMGVAVVLGLIMALTRLSPSPVVASLGHAYIAVFRAVPALVQMVFWYNLAALFPRLSIGVPFGPTFVDFRTTSLFSSFLAATLGLGLSEAAYMAEIYRGGLASVPQGQFDAARAIGMRRAQALRHVILPQAMKAVIPPTGNQVIGMLKYTSLASVIAVTELLQSVTLIFSRTFQTMPLLIVASLWYLALTTVLTIGQRRIERHYGRGTALKTSLVVQVWRAIVNRQPLTDVTTR